MSSCKHYFKVWFEEPGGTHYEFIEVEDEYEVKDTILRMHPNANPASIRPLRCTKEEYERESF